MSIGEDLDDRALVARFLGTRDEASFRMLYRRYTPAMYGLALRLLSRRSDAEDVVQEAWIRATERLGGFRWDASIRTWLSSIVVNCCREASRTDWRWISEENPASEGRALAVPALELTVDVDRAIAKLPSGCRSVFVLHDIEGRTHQEIGTLLDIDPGTSKSQLFHARRHLRSLLQ